MSPVPGISSLHSDEDVELTEDGRIVDFLDPATVLEDTPEERVRQWMLKSLSRDFDYPRSVMSREVEVTSGSKLAEDSQGNPIRADIIIYNSSAARASKDQGQIKFVVECKKPDVQTGYAQLVSYIYNTSAAGGVWTNGKDIQTYSRQPYPENSLQPAPGIPRVHENWDSVSRLTRDDLDRPKDVRGGLRLCHNKLHGRGIDGDEEDLAMDMVRILLAKAQDEIGATRLPEFYVTPSEYISESGREAVANRVQSLFRQFADDNPGVFSEHEKISVSSTALVEVVAVMQRWEILTRLEDADEWDIMGSAYEQYTAAHLKRQRGQFFTNRLLVQAMTTILDPDENVRALDPAGGSGGFITAILRYVRRKILANTQSGPQRERQLENLRQRIFMVESSPRLVKIAKTAMLLNGDGHAGITQGDSLGTYERLDEWIRARCPRAAPTVIATNPPFAGQGEGRITDSEILSRFDVGHRWDFSSDIPERLDSLVSEGCPPEMLFFERCLDWLSPGGRMGIVLPKSFLDTATYKTARHVMLRDAKLLGVVNCHKDTFQPHTGVRTCVVFLQKRSEDEPEDDDYQVFMAISRKPGQDSEGKPIRVLGEDGDQTEQLDEDISLIADSYREFASGGWSPSEYRFSTHISEIRESGNANPQYHLPLLNESLRAVERMDGIDGMDVVSLSGIAGGASIFKGPRLKTENILIDGPEDGSDPAAYFTPSTVLQDRRESVKWLDLDKATDQQLVKLEEVRVQEGDILITRSGSIGRVALVLSDLDGQIVSDDMIRVRIPDEPTRHYVYGFLITPYAQDQMKLSEYGSVQQHLEPKHIADLRIPVPSDWTRAEPAIAEVRAYVAAREESVARSGGIDAEWNAIMESGV